MHLFFIEMSSQVHHTTNSSLFQSNGSRAERAGAVIHSLPKLLKRKNGRWVCLFAIKGEKENKIKRCESTNTLLRFSLFTLFLFIAEIYLARLGQAYIGEGRKKKKIDFGYCLFPHVQVFWPYRFL